jgi:anti-sigma regulatory factor (Ser/Thr protein kinase)
VLAPLQRESTAGLRLDSYPGAHALVVRPVGTLTTESYLGLRDDLLGFAAQEPPAIVVDLDGMRVVNPSVLAVFSTVWMRIDDWPGVSMALVAARQPLRALLDASAVPRFVPTFRSVADALQALGALPRRRREVYLSCDPASVRRARRVVEQACREWEMPGIATEAPLVAAELTTNMVRHARSDGCLRIELRGRMLTISVLDADLCPPRVRPPHERRDGGRGMVLIAELSQAWGWAPRAQGGKVVWATLAVPSC